MRTNVHIDELTSQQISSCWIKESSLEETTSFLRKFASYHALRAGAQGTEVKKLLDSSDWHSIVDYRIDYGRDSVTELSNLRQALAFFTKLEQLPLGVDKEAAAFTKFTEAEAQCLETNRRLRSARRPGGIQTPSRVASVFYTAQRKIANVLGDVPSLDQLKCAFGPGANTSISARASSARWKLDAKPTCSVELVPALEPVLRCFPSYCECHRTFKTGLVAQLEDHCDNIAVDVEINLGKLQFVPKNAKTYRSIVVEPMLNSLMQKGIGSWISKRLRRAGIDIATQSERNKKLAQRSSFDGSLATIDLSSASDTISQEIVEELLPYDWVSFLRNFRTGTVTYRGTPITLEKFSSMGNAYTFELETLIFWALAWACASIERCDASETVSYGDDILLPTGAVPLLHEVLDWAGFSVNLDKSFWSGPFRESCGGDYFNGIDIRPYYQKDLVSGRSLFTLYNFYVRSLQLEAAAMVLECIPQTLRLWGPDGYGDGHLIGSWSHVCRPPKNSGYGGVIFDTFSLKGRSIKKPLPIGDRLLPAYSIYVLDGVHSEPTDPYRVRGSRGYRRTSIYTLSTGVLIP